MNKRNMLKSLGTDFRFYLLLIPAVMILATNMPLLMTLGYSMAVMLLVAAVSHITRKVVFPYLDMEVVMRKATETPTGAGYVFLGVSSIITAMIIGSVMWLSN